MLLLPKLFKFKYLFPRKNTGIYSVAMFQKEGHDLRSCPSFWVPRSLAAPPFGDFNPRAGKARPPEILRFAPNLRRTRGAAQKGRWVVFCSQSQG